MLRNATQFSLVTDASAHSNREVVVSLCHADGHSMMIPITICKQGQINATDVDLPSFSQLSDIGKKQEIERESAYYFIKAISHELDALASGRVNIATFKIDGDTSRPVKPGEHRVRRSRQGMLHIGGHSDNAEGHSDNAEGLSDNAEGLNDNVGGHRDNDINDGFIYVTEHVARIRKVDGSLVPVLPTNLSWQMQRPMLTLSIDQGGAGMAAAAFLLKDHTLHTRRDNTHRVVRDYKLAIGGAADGLFLKAQHHSGCIFFINYKPFNKGNFFEQKKDMVEAFLATKQLVRSWEQLVVMVICWSL